MNKGICFGGIWGLLFGHDIEHVFESEEGDPKYVPDTEAVKADLPNPTGIEDLIRASSGSKERYIHSICKRCGLVIEKPNTMAKPIFGGDLK